MVIINNNNSRYPLDRRHTKRPLTLTPVRCPKPFAFLGNPSLRHLSSSPTTLRPATMVEVLGSEMGIVCGIHICIVLRLLRSGRGLGERVCQLFFRIRSVFLVATVALARWVSVCAAACFYQRDGGTVMQVSHMRVLSIAGAVDDPYPRF